LHPPDRRTHAHLKAFGTPRAAMHLPPPRPPPARAGPENRVSTSIPSKQKRINVQRLAHP
jgi:hypothetical protein